MTLLTLTMAHTILLKSVTSQKMSRHRKVNFYPQIEDFPHSVLLQVNCTRLNYCGASILSVFTLLSAAKCVETCTKNIDINAYTGDDVKTRILDFKVHENYNRDTSANDIAVLILKDDLKFSMSVQRVILLDKSPKIRVAVIAGWEGDDEGKSVLQYASQGVLRREACIKELGYIPIGTICGINLDKNWPERDSGYALMAHSVVQIGLASRRRANCTVYTDVPYFYRWIEDAVRELLSKNFCPFCDTYLV